MLRSSLIQELWGKLDFVRWCAEKIRGKLSNWISPLPFSNKKNVNYVSEEVSLEENGKTHGAWAVNGKIADFEETGFTVINMRTFAWSLERNVSKSNADRRRINGGKALLTESKTPDGQTLLWVWDSSNQVDFVLYSLIVTACNGNAPCLVVYGPNIFARY